MLHVERIRERGIVSLAINNIAGHVPVSAWCFSDPQDKFHHGMFFDPKCMTFAPIPKLRKHVRAKLPDGTFRTTKTRVQECPGTFGFQRGTTFYPETFFSSEEAQWGRGGKQPDPKPFTCLCTMLLGIRLLHYLGCQKVYMIGVDFWMTDKEQYAFGQTKRASNTRYKNENAMLQELVPTFKKHNFQMFNCNPDSKCDAFPYVSFEKAIEDCKGAVPQEPFDLSHWYDKELIEEQAKKFPSQVSQQEIQEIQNKTKS